MGSGPNIRLNVAAASCRLIRRMASGCNWSLMTVASSSSCSSGWKSWEWPISRNRAVVETSSSVRRERKLSAPPDMDINRAISILMQYVSEQRAKSLREVLQLRTSQVRALFENPSNYNNVFASLRTLDSFGVHYTDIVNSTGKKGEGNSTRQSMISSLGAIKWLSVTHTTDSAKEVLTKLKCSVPDLRIYVSDIHCKHSQPLNDIKWTPKCPSVVVFGNVESGVSEEVKSMADVSFYIPMKGFAESLNLSASVAVTFTHLENKGALTPNLSEEEMDSILLEWLLKSVKGSEAILRRYSSSDSMDALKK